MRQEPLRRGETVDIVLDVTNPGVWMEHCHIAEHHESGMMLDFHVDPRSTPQRGSDERPMPAGTSMGIGCQLGLVEESIDIAAQNPNIPLESVQAGAVGAPHLDRFLGIGILPKGARSISDGIDPATSTGRLMLNMLTTLAEYERELIVERVNAGGAASHAAGTRFGRPVSDPAVVEDKQKIVSQARADGKTAAQAAELVGWSRATLYRHQQALASTGKSPAE